MKVDELRIIRNELSAFIDGSDRSMAMAATIEGALDHAFPEDEEIQDCVLALASYQPGGGPLLYGTEEMALICRRALKRLAELERD